TWNKKLPEDLFRLNIPAGTHVLDTLNNVQFVAGKNDPGENLQDLAANARDLVALSPTRPLGTPSLFRQALACLLVTLIGILLVLLSVRIHRHMRGVRHV